MANGPGNLTEPDEQANRPAATAFFPALGRVLRGSFSYTGRARRTDLAIYAVTALWLVPLALSLGELAADRDMPRAVELGLGVVLAIPFIALFVRRCHDSGRSGGWAWLLLPGLAMPLLRGVVGLQSGIAGTLMLDRFVWPLDWLAIATNLAAVVLCLVPGTAGPNRFGEAPREPVSADIPPAGRRSP